MSEDISLDHNIILYDLCQMILKFMWQRTHVREEQNTFKYQEEEKMMIKSLDFFLEEKSNHTQLYQILNQGRLNITKPNPYNESLKY